MSETTSTIGKGTGRVVLSCRSQAWKNAEGNCPGELD